MTRSYHSQKQFNQRCFGLRKKANDLRKICGVHVAVFIQDYQDGDKWLTFQSRKDWPYKVNSKNINALFPDNFTTVHEASLRSSSPASSPHVSSPPTEISNIVEEDNDTIYTESHDSYMEDMGAADLLQSLNNGSWNENNTSGWNMNSEIDCSSMNTENDTMATTTGQGSFSNRKFTSQFAGPSSARSIQKMKSGMQRNIRSGTQSQQGKSIPRIQRPR